MGGILRNNNSRLLTAGGTADHVHLLVSQSKKISLSELVMDVKKDSSSWLKTQDRNYRNFHWQDGYGGFSVSVAEVPSLKRYIANQKEHHRKVTFQEELLQLVGNMRLSTTSDICGIEVRPLQGRTNFALRSVGVAHGY